ncbi:MAG: YjgN family protein [Gammaproteobacteria bacterium]
MDLTAEQLNRDRSNQPEFAVSSAASSREQFRFHGKAGEYFRIWIVNMCLTILTLGIYSAWAKVRKNRYIYGNLELAGSHFDYLAKPLVILRGRLIALAMLGVFYGIQVVSPGYSFLFLIFLGLLTPWLLVRSRMFNMRYTIYRNIRFGFNPAYSQSYKVIFGYAILTIITLGLAAPYAHYKRNRLIVDNTRFGVLRLRLDPIAREFFLAYGLAALLGVALVVPLSSLLESVGFGGAENAEPVFPIMVLVPIIVMGLAYFTVGQFINAYILKATTNGTAIGAQEDGHRLGCDWNLSGMLGILVTNMIAIIFSLGLLIPWAQMRVMRFQLDRTWVDVNGDLNGVMAGQQEEVSSLGEEIGDVFDVDIGL